MRVLSHPDPWVLETELLDRVARAKADDPLAPVLVVVPTRRLADHLSRRFAKRFGTVLGVDVLVHRALARRVLEDSGGSSRPFTHRALVEVLLSSVLRRRDGDRLAAFVEANPGAVTALLASLDDLREAGITPAEARSVLRDEPERSLADLYEAFTREVDGLRIGDDAAIVSDALPRAPSWARRYRLAIHHGAYELIGVNLDLVRAIDEGCEVQFLLPYAPDAPAYRYAGEFASRHLLRANAAIEPIAPRDGGLLGDRLAILYDETARPEPLAEGTFSASHAQGPAIELDHASRRALRQAVSLGPAEVAIVGRSLGGYAEAIDGLLDREDGLWTAAIAGPARREPGIADLLLVLRVVADGYPRAATAEILRSPRIRWDRLAPGDEPFDGGPAERWTRRARILGGLEAWMRDLPAWAATPDHREEASDDRKEAARRRAEERRRVAERLGGALRSLDALVAPREPRSWVFHADALERLADHLLDDAGDGAKTLEDAISVLRDRQTSLGEAGPVSFESALAFLERTIDRTEIASRGADEGGIAVLDFPQARGLTFESLQVVGLNAGVVPRPWREDPFLRDGARRALRQATGRPIGVKAEGADEERLLLALVLGSARVALHVSWQRADETGRTRASSIAQREIARVALGRPHAALLRERSRTVPAHPGDRLRLYASESELLRVEDAEILAALDGVGGGDRSHPGHALVSATESFDPSESAYDGRVGRPVFPGRALSVTALQTLGRCPLRYFFRYGLRVRELDDESDPFEVSRSEIGIDVHALLETLYRALDGEGLFASPDVDGLVSRAREILTSLRETDALPGTRRLARRLPLLGAIEHERWWTAVVAFVEEDTRRLGEERWRPSGLEATRRGSVDLGDVTCPPIEGRLDRILGRDDGEVLVGDYKTSGTLADLVSPAKILRGEALQAPLYHVLASGPVEFLGVGPDFGEGRPGRFAGFSSREMKEGFLETLGILVELAQGGRFPLRTGAWCRSCPYAAACRRTHAPTLERHEHAFDTRSFRALASKSKKAPRLEDVAAAGSPDDAEDEA